MIYLYDNALVSDLQSSFNSIEVPGTTVTVVGPEDAIGVAAQLHDDSIKFPILALFRDSDVAIDSKLSNFSRLQVGVLSEMNTQSNELYYEMSAPLDLKYSLTILTTRIADMDEIVKELVFKYTAMYFLSIHVPYECKRTIRFGVSIDSSRSIERSASVHDYISGGKLFQTIVPLKCDGCVMLTYRPVKLKRAVIDKPNLI